MYIGYKPLMGLPGCEQTPFAFCHKYSEVKSRYWDTSVFLLFIVGRIYIFILSFVNIFVP